MRETSVDGGEFTYEAVGTPKAALVTSSIKKGVWWIRHLPSPNDLDSPLLKKFKEQEGSDSLPMGMTLTKKDIDSQHEAVDLLPMGTTASTDVGNRVTHAEKITDDKLPVLFTMLSTTKKHSEEESTKSEDRKGSEEHHRKLTDDSKPEKEQHSTPVVDDKTPPKQSQVCESDCVSSHKGLLTVLEQDCEIDRIIDSLFAKLSWKEASKIKVEEGKTPMESPAGKKMVRGDDCDFAVVSAFPFAVKHGRRDFSGMSGVSTDGVF